jgi:hypothetical protein
MNRELLLLFLCVIGPIGMVGLSGCVADQAHRQDVSFAPPATTFPVSLPALTPTLEPIIEQLHNDLKTSQNVSSQGFSGVGLQLSKVGDSVDASLLKIHNTLHSSMEANAQVSAELSARLNAVLNLNSQLIAKLESKIDATLLAQAGIANRLENYPQTASSGRDSIQTQFTHEMRDTLVSDNRTLLAVVLSMGAVICFLQWRSRCRADARHKAADSLLREKWEKRNVNKIE